MKVIIVNGHPEAGKDTFCEILSGKFECITHSSVNTTKRVAYILGWNGDKTVENRRMLSDLKDFADYWFDASYKEMIGLIQAEKDSSILDCIFLHIREIPQIERIVNYCFNEGISVKTVLITMARTGQSYSNDADALVNDYIYDAYIGNNGTKEQFKENILGVDW